MHNMLCSFFGVLSNMNETFFCNFYRLENDAQRRRARPGGSLDIKASAIAETSHNVFVVRYHGGVI